MKAKTATITKTRHKGKDVHVVDLGRTRIEGRYTRPYTAAVGAARASMDFLKAGGNLKIIYPDGRKRLAYMYAETLTFGQLVVPTVKRKRK